MGEPTMSKAEEERLLRPHASIDDPDAPIFSAVRRAGLLEGWMEHHELLWLAERAMTRARIVEFGSYCGRSAKAMAGTTPGTLWCVDPWTQERAEPGSSWKAFSRNLADEIATKKVIPLRMKSAEGARFLLANNFRADMVFVDGDHSEAGCAADIEAGIALLGGSGSGGLLCGHDMYRCWPGVMRAVARLLPEYRLPIYGAGTIWVVTL